MPRHTEIELSGDPATEVARLRGLAVGTTRVLVFKQSPICPVSRRAEQELHAWLAERDGAIPLQLAIVDVIGEKPMARGLTAELGIEHQSPQALLFVGGELVWHDSHAGLSRGRLAEMVDG